MTVKCWRCGVNNLAGSTTCAACQLVLSPPPPPPPPYAGPPGAYPPPPAPYGQPAPQGFSPQQSAGYFPPMNAATAEPRPRSAIPKVVGILMIIFASLGIIVGLYHVATAGVAAEALDEPRLGRFIRWSKVLALVGLSISVLHLVGGIRAVTYRANAPRLAITYAIVNMAFIVLNAIITYAMLLAIAGGRSEVPSSVMGVGVVMGSIISMAWPIVVLSLMTRPRAKEACQL
jgi:hypothetical protein